MKKYARFIKFVGVGVLNTLNYYIIYLVMMKLFEQPYMISHITGFVISLVISFYLNCYLVYHVRPTFRRFFAFPLTQIVNMTIQTLMLYICVDILHLSEWIAPLPALVISVPITYVATTFILKEKDDIQ